MSAYYNEIEPFAAEWLRNLIAAGHIAPGDVDTRSIEDVSPDDLRAYTQCHFFAGIGVWSYALRRAGWTDDRPVWTGSCPCQPFSAAGKGAGFADERHLWPAWYHLIRERRPRVVFGEQSASPRGLTWLDLIHTDLEAADYAIGAVDCCAASVGAPHVRQRLWFVAEGVEHAAGDGRLQRWAASSGRGDSGLADPHGRHASAEREQPSRQHGLLAEDRRTDDADQPSSPTNGPWRDADWLYCQDGKWRPVEPDTFPLAHGATRRVGRLRAYGNAIVAEVAETFIRAYDSCCVTPI